MLRFLPSLLGLILFIVCTFTYASASDETFSIYLAGPQTDRYGANVTINAGSMPISDLNKFITTGPLENQAQRNDIIDVIVVVPRGATLESRSRFQNQIREQLQSAGYSRLKFQIRESFVDLEEDAQTLLEEKAKFEELQKHLPPQSQAATSAEKAISIIEQGLSDDQVMASNWGLHLKSLAGYPFQKLNNSHPYKTVIAARVVAVSKLSISAALILGKYGLNLSSALIAALSGGVAAAFGYNAKKWSSWCTTHQIPWFKNFAPMRAYNQTGWFKSAHINWWRSMGLSFIYKGLAHLTNQQSHGVQVPSPVSTEFLVSGLGLTIPEIVLDGLMDDGARALELKARINHQTRSYLLWIVGMIDTTMHGFFRANATKAAYMTAAVSWGAKLAIWGTSKLLSPHPRRFIFVSDKISSQAQAKLVEDKSSFFSFLRSLGTSITSSIRNLRSGKYSESDRTMVLQDLGLGEEWQIALNESDLQKIHYSKELTQSEFSKLLNLNDSDPKIVDALWNERNARLGDPSWSLWEACGRALEK